MKGNLDSELPIHMKGNLDSELPIHMKGNLDSELNNSIRLLYRKI